MDSPFDLGKPDRPRGIDNFPRELAEVLNRIFRDRGISICPSWTVPPLPPPSPWPTHPLLFEALIDQLVLVEDRVRIVRTKFALKPEWGESGDSRDVSHTSTLTDRDTLIGELQRHFDAKGNPDYIMVGDVLYEVRDPAKWGQSAGLSDRSLLPNIIKIGDTYFERIDRSPKHDGLA